MREHAAPSPLGDAEKDALPTPATEHDGAHQLRLDDLRTAILDYLPLTSASLAEAGAAHAIDGTVDGEVWEIRQLISLWEFIEQRVWHTLESVHRQMPAGADPRAFVAGVERELRSTKIPDAESDVVGVSSEALVRPSYRDQWSAIVGQWLLDRLGMGDTYPAESLRLDDDTFGMMASYADVFDRGVGGWVAGLMDEGESPGDMVTMYFVRLRQRVRRVLRSLIDRLPAA